MTDLSALDASQPAAEAGSDFPLRLPAWLGLTLISLAMIVAYWPALSGQLLWDDTIHIPNAKRETLEGLGRIWTDPRTTQQYYPLLFSWFWLQHRLWGDSMLGYHLVNLLQQIVAVWLLYAILRKLSIPGAWLAAALFALHPVFVESVAWVTQQKNTLSGVFYLGAMLAYLHFDTGRKLSSYFLALVLFIAAVLSKTTTVTLPPALLVIFWWQRGTLSWRRDVLPLVPFFLVAAADGLFTSWVERNILNAKGSEFELTLIQGVLLFGRATWFYLEKLIWPADLMFVYPRWDIDPIVGWQWLFPVATVAVLALLLALAIQRQWRAPLAAALFFIGSLFPVLGFLNVFFFRYSYVTDHFQYLASLGIITLVAAGLTLAIERLAPAARSAGNFACVVLLGILATLTWQQSKIYGGDVVTLYRATLEQNPDCWMIHNNLGAILLNQNNPQEAAEHFEETKRLVPQHYQGSYNLGRALFAMDRTQEAIAQFEQALQIRPDVVDAHVKLAAALVNMGQPREAIEHCEIALQLDPENGEAHNNLAVAYLHTGQLPEALEHAQTAVRLVPVSAFAQNNLGSALFQSGQPQDAVERFQEAVRLKPDYPEALNNLGAALKSVGRPQDAIEPLQEALRLKPDFLEAWSNLAAVSALSNHPTEAVAAAEKAIALARAQGQTALAQHLEAWLNAFRAGASSAPPSLPDSALPPPTP